MKIIYIIVHFDKNHNTGKQLMVKVSPIYDPCIGEVPVR